MKYKYISHKDTRIVHIAIHYEKGIWISLCKPCDIATDHKYKIYQEDRLGGKSMCKDCLTKVEKRENSTDERI